MQFIENYLNRAKELDLYPERYLIHRKKGIQYNVTEESSSKTLNVLNFSSNDILGLAQNPIVKQETIRAIQQFGSSNSSANFCCGRIDLHQELEQEISQFKQIPHTHLFLNAWMALQGFTDIFCHLSMKIPGYNPELKTLIMVDEMNHSCLTAAATSAKTGTSGTLFSRNANPVVVKPYRHCNVESLASRIKRFIKPGWRILVMTDAVFSMDGDIAPLPDIIKVLSNYEGSVLLTDEAHSSGALGSYGGGIYNHFNIDPRDLLSQGIHPVLLTTFSKFGGSVGASISSFSQGLTDLLYAARTSSGTASLAAPLTAAALTSIRHLRQTPNLVKQLHENTDYLRSQLQHYGFQVPGQTHIIPVEIEQFPKEFAHVLMHNYGIWVTPVWYISNPKLRIMANATYTCAQMDTLVKAMVAVRDELSEATTIAC
ncbi:MAG: pyridoxal phosphate-dependent aminotransferase family protein [Cyanobacteria bacterium J06639_14]